MSRSYRVSVKESENRVLRAADWVSTCLEIIEVLPPEQTAGLLRDELKKRGFVEEGGKLVGREKGVAITVDPATATVTVSAEAAQHVALESERSGTAYDDDGSNATQVRAVLKKEAKQDIDRRAREKTAELQTKVTDRLEARLGDVRKEMDEVVNRVTAEALKRKAASMGQIKELTEDPEAGSLTIVVEV
jgi:hypothetical protein